EELPLRLHLPADGEALRAAAARYRLKSVLNLGMGGLIITVVAGVGWMVRRERQLVRAREDFVASVSHELQTPLAAIRLMGETLGRKRDGSPYPERIVAEADRLAFMVRNILSYNRLHRAGGWQPRMERVELGESAHDLRR